MVVIPDSEIRLLKCPIALDNKNQLNFTNQSSQFNYFNSLPHIVLDNATYVRKDGYIRFDNDDNLHYEQLLEYNYVMYKNTNYSNKWFYAFITSMVYQNDNLTDIYIETDVFQSWMWDWLFHYSFIEREMINVEDDLIGNNTVPENLELGEYITTKTWRHNPFDETCFVMTVTEYINGTKPLATNFGGIWQAGRCLCY